MSYFTQVDFQFSEEIPDFTVVVECARAQFDAEQYAIEDIIVDLRRGWEEGKTEFNRLERADIESLMCRVSAKFPAMLMCVRGIGEEGRDFWLREFQKGKITFSAGPYLTEEKPAFFRFFNR